MKYISSVFLLFLLAGISGCSRGSIDDGNGRIAAVVNGVEITQAEVDYLYKISGGVAANEQLDENQRRLILGNIVRTELLAQKAREMQLDKSPDFSLAMHDARRRVLAEFAKREIGGKVPTVSPEAAREVVANNPNLFVNRKFLVYDEVIIPDVNEPLLKALDEKADKGFSLNQLLDELRAKNVQFQHKQKALTSDQIQPAILGILIKLSSEKPQVVRVGNKYSMILMLESTVPLPLVGDAAVQTAGMALTAQNRNAAIKRSMADMVNRSKISYFGEYAKPVVGENALASLPLPDKEDVKKTLYRRIGLSGLLSLSIVAAMLILTAAMRVINGKLWIPRLVPQLKKNGVQIDPYESPYQPYLLEKLYIFSMAALIFGLLFFENYLLWNILPTWAIIIALLVGYVLGVYSGRLYKLDFLRRLSSKIYLFFMALFSLPIIISIFLILRYARL
jgi:EpsD family peptidyl-prolyl cis-trans isomerase